MVAAVLTGPVTNFQAADSFNKCLEKDVSCPNRLASPALPGSQRTTDRWFNTGAFAQAPQFSIGSSSRNPVEGPGYRTLDGMLGKTFRLTERTGLEFRVESFNATNTPPLGNPNGIFGNAAFGTITTALDPRVYELVLKLHF